MVEQDLPKAQLLSIKKLWVSILNNSPFILSSMFVITFATIVYSYFVTPIYESKALMTQSAAMKNSNASSPSLSDVASFVSGGDGNKQNYEEKIAMTRMLSKDYFRERVYENSFLINCLFSECDAANFAIADNFYNQKYEDGSFIKPPFMLAYRYFRSRYDIFPNVELITFTFRHQSPRISYEFLNWLISDGNNYVRDIEIQKSQSSIDYLTSKLEDTKNLEIQKLIGALIQKDYQKMSLSQNSENYAYEMVDTPIIPSDRIYPKRSLMAVVSLLTTFFIAMSFVVLIEYLNFSLSLLSKFNNYFLSKLKK